MAQAAGSIRGACFGYGVRSSVPLTFLRDGTGPELQVSEAPQPPGAGDRAVVSRREQDGRTVLELYEEADGTHSIWYPNLGWFTIDGARPAIGVPPQVPSPVWEARMWGLPAALCFIARGDQSLHAASVDVGGRAIVLAAPGRFGKTTFAAGFVQAGHRLLSEDITCFRAAGGEPAIVPGPAQLRIRRDVQPHLTLPGTSVVADDGDRIFVAVDPGRRGGCEPVPLAAVVFLREHDGPPRLERVTKQLALPDLFALAFRLPTEADHARCFAAVAALAEAVPVYDVHRRLVLDDLPAAVNLVAELAG